MAHMDPYGPYGPIFRLQHNNVTYSSYISENDSCAEMKILEFFITPLLSSFLVPGMAKTFRVRAKIVGLPKFEPELITNLTCSGF